MPLHHRTHNGGTLVSKDIADLLHRLATAKRSMDAYPKGKGVTSEAVVRQFYADTLRRLADALIAEGYGE